MLTAATTFSRLTAVAEIPRAAQGGPGWASRPPAAAPPAARQAGAPAPGGGSGFVQCIDVDRTEQLFATCSGSRVHVWRYTDVLRAAPDQQAAAGQLCGSGLGGGGGGGGAARVTGASSAAAAAAAAGGGKRQQIMNLAFSRQHSEVLACGDSDGLISLYDVATLQQVAELEAHDNRIWALDFAPAVGAGAAAAAAAGGRGAGGGGHHQAHCLVSGSDDYTVRVSECAGKLWCSCPFLSPPCSAPRLH